MLLLGPSGAGKSTLLAAFAGLLDSSGGGQAEGTLDVAGEPPHRARAGVGLLFQDPDAQLVLARAGDDVAFGLENRCVPAERIWPAVDAALAAARFPYGRERSTAALSGGEKQRLALAGTLALRPRLLLLDEPTANLDPDGARALRAALAGALADRAMTLVMVEHRVIDAMPLVDRVVVIEAGRGVVADGEGGGVFAEHGERLAARGVWVPGRPPPSPPRRAGPPGEERLRGSGLAFRYPGTADPALDGVDVTLRAGEALALVGPNGSGKTTLAFLLAGLLRPERGTLAPALWRWPARALVRRSGMVFQEPEHQFVRRRVDEELLVGPRRAGVGEGEARRRADDLLARLSLTHLAAANPFTLSGGEKRRLSVATALATSPGSLVLDEPTFGQDRRTHADLAALLAGLRDEGAAVCFASHDEDLVAALADRTLRLASGRLAA